MIVNCVRTFKNDDYVFFLMEYVQGIEIFDVIREIGLLNLQECQFYIGSIVLAIEYLHYKRIIYRDLKPENVMTDSKGFIKLIDMGAAKVIKTTNEMTKTFTIVGTPHYMAPEVFSGKGYGFNVDFWSIGVCLFEFMAGFVPYGEDQNDPFEIYREIMRSKQLLFPHYVNDSSGKSLMTQLLNKNPELRHGGSFATLKAHRFFNRFNWVKHPAFELAWIKRNWDLLGNRKNCWIWNSSLHLFPNPNSTPPKSSS